MIYLLLALFCLFTSQNSFSAVKKSNPSKKIKSPLAIVKQKNLTIHRTPKKPKLTHSQTHNIITSLQKILSHKKNGTIYVNSFFISNENFVQTLIDIHQQTKGKVVIQVVIDKLSLFHGKKVLNMLHAAGIPIYVYNGGHSKLSHSKNIFWSYTYKKNKIKYGLFDGSYNLTNLAAGNLEQAVFSRIKESTFNKYKKFFERIIAQSSPYRDTLSTQLITKKLEDSSPQVFERTIFSSPKKNPDRLFSPFDNIDKSIIERINRTVSGGRIYIMSYSYNMPELTNALYKARQRGVKVSLILDRYALLKKISSVTPIKESKIQLDRLHAAGVKILIYADKGILKNHTKCIGIIDKNRTLYAQGSYNLSPSSQKSFNTFTWYPPKDATKMVASMRSVMKSIHPKCSAYTDFLAKKTNVYMPGKAFQEKLSQSSQEENSDPEENIFSLEAFIEGPGIEFEGSSNETPVCYL